MKKSLRCRVLGAVRRPLVLTFVAVGLNGCDSKQDLTTAQAGGNAGASSTDMAPVSSGGNAAVSMTGGTGGRTGIPPFGGACNPPGPWCNGIPVTRLDAGTSSDAAPDARGTNAEVDAHLGNL